jgi:hypothetical protein
VACCIGLLAEVNAPDADAFSILLPSGNGNATQINILEGNIFDPQFGLGGNGSNTSHNSTIGALFFGQGNGASAGTSGGSLFGPISLGGATGNGNVTQINILSYNIFNPQVSLTGGNYSKNTTISNVAVNNGNGSTAASTSGSGPAGLFGGAIGNGNTTQYAFFSGNIFNPQFGLFGPNASDNTSILNVAGANGNNSTTNVTSGGLFGTALFGQTGNGNTNQTVVGGANIFNPQFSLLGTNLSRNYANANQASGNGGTSGNQVGSTGGGMWNFLAIGDTGNGNTTQNAQGSGNIYNDQWRFGMGNFLPALPTTQPAPQVTPNTQDAAEATNEQVTFGTGQSGPLTHAELPELQKQQAGSSSSTGTVVAPRSLKDVATRLRTAVGDTIDRITQPRSTPTGGATSAPAAAPSAGSES